VEQASAGVTTNTGAVVGDGSTIGTGVEIGTTVAGLRIIYTIPTATKIVANIPSPTSNVFFMVWLLSKLGHISRLQLEWYKLGIAQSMFRML
jgi:hypothetical protein